MKRIRIMLSALVIAVIVSGCSTNGASILFVNGLAEKAYTKRELQSFPQIESAYMNKDGEVAEYSGVSITSIIKESGIEEYSIVTLIASDGYSAEVTSEELTNCDKCIIAFQDDGGLLVVMPDFSSKLQVKDLSELQVD